jgi:hypothetical protein
LYEYYIDVISTLVHTSNIGSYASNVANYASNIGNVSSGGYASNVANDASNMGGYASNVANDASNMGGYACNVANDAFNIGSYASNVANDASNVANYTSNIALTALSTAEYSSNMTKQWIFNHESNVLVSSGGTHVWYDMFGTQISTFNISESGMYCTDMFWSHDQSMFDVIYPYDIVRERTWNSTTVLQFMDESCFHCNPGDKLSIYASSSANTYTFSPESLWVITKK